MMTWKLWRALQAPSARHPLFTRIANQNALPIQRYLGSMWPAGITGLLILFALGVWYSPQAIMPTLFNPSFALIVGLVLFTGTVYGLVWAVSIATMITRLRGEGKYDLLCLSPLSPFGINWTICTGFLHRNQLLTRITTQRTRAAQIALVLPGAFIMPLLISTVTNNTDFTAALLVTTLHICAITSAFQLDHIQSTVVGSLIGIHAPLHTLTALDARLLAGVGFLTLQLISYLLSAYIGFVLLPQLYLGLSINGVLMELTMPVLQLAVFYLSREVVILLLWQGLVRQLTASPAELELLTL